MDSHAPDNISQGIPTTLPHERVANWLRVGPLSLALALLGFVIVGLPLISLIWELAQDPDSFRVWIESRRILQTARNSALYGFGAVAIALPVACIVAFSIFRASPLAQRAIYFAVILSLLIPSPVWVAAWRPSLTWLKLDHGLVPATILQALVLLPWIVFPILVAQLCLPRQLTNDAIVAGGKQTLLRYVWVPAHRDVFIAIILFGFIQSFQEITITNLFQINTFAEEVYIQFSRPDPQVGKFSSGTAVAAAASLPVTLLLASLARKLLLRLSTNRFFNQNDRTMFVTRVTKGRMRSWPLLIVILFWLLLLGPIADLLRLAGTDGRHDMWSTEAFLRNLITSLQFQSYRLLFTCSIAVITGLSTALVGLIVAARVRHNTPFGQALLFILLIVWCLPGPLLGMGLKTSINVLIQIEQALPLRTAWVQEMLYLRPSPLPIIWAQFLRFLPLAVTLSLPAWSRIVNPQREAAVINGSTRVLFFLHVIWPTAKHSFWLTTLMIAALSLGELSTSKLVATPDGDTMAIEIFMQLHYSLNHLLAAMCLILLTLAASIAIAINRFIRPEAFLS